MADWHGTCRSNYFRVKDRKAFEEALAQFDAELLDHPKEGSDAVGFISTDQFGGVPTRYYDDEGDELDGPINILDVIGEHILPGDVCIIMEVGAEKARYVTGEACAIWGSDENQSIRLSLDSIYDLVKEKTGIEPTKAEY